MTTYKVKYRQYRYTLDYETGSYVAYEGDSLTKAYAVHDTIMAEVRLAGPMTSITVQKIQEGTVSFLQHTQVRSNG